MKRFLPAVFVLTLALVARAEDAGWPRVHQVGDSEVTVFQPQIDGWDDYQTLRFRVAIAVRRTASADPVYGAVVGKAQTVVDWDTRTVHISDAAYPSINFPGATAADADACLAIARQVVDPSKTWDLALDRIVADVHEAKDQRKPATVNLDPPPIFYAKTDAILVVFLGPPSYQPIPGTKLLFATNTNWTVVMDPAGGQVYLLDGDGWLTAPDVQKGPWTAATSLPPDMSNLPDDKSWAAVREKVPGEPTQVVPQVFVGDRPAELIVTTGDPQLVSIPGTMLLYAANTTSDLFLDVSEGKYYFLASGRWFSAPQPEGPWAAATKSLPADFARIPVDSPKADALASVPNTRQAAEAVLVASIPHTATVDRAKTIIVVTYHGEPLFQPLEGVDGVTVAQNTDDLVFQVAGQCYCCRNGVWFQAPSATGSWAVCTNVPEILYTIPADSPYNIVTYVNVYESTPSSVTVGYTEGYTGAYVVGGLLMFGAGYWRADEIARAAVTPYLAWHYPPTWYAYGTAARYDVATGAFVRGAAHYGPYGGAGYAARYDPATGTYARGAAAYGPYRGAGAAAAYNPWTGRAGATAQHAGPYGSWGKTAGWQTSAGGAGAVHEGPRGTTGVAHTATGNVYAGHDGNVYRHTPTGGWEQHTSDGWHDPGWPKSSPQLHAPGGHMGADEAGGLGGDRGDQQRSLDDEARNRNYGNFRAGGGFRGGGGRRR